LASFRSVDYDSAVVTALQVTDGGLALGFFALTEFD